MASTKAWMSVLGHMSDVHYKERPTHIVYDEIASFGFDTVKWKRFIFDNDPDIQIFLDELGRFLEKHSPCLFVFDPKKEFVSRLTKGYLFNVTDLVTIEDWLLENKSDLVCYEFLITTMVINDYHGGMLGSVFSDGEGKLVCEVLKKKGLSNHRALSQLNDKELYVYRGFFSCDEFKVIASEGTLTYNEIIYIKEHFLSKKGYFEFIIGTHLSIQGIYVTGYEPLASFKFPIHVVEQKYFDLSSRMHLLLLHY